MCGICGIANMDQSGSFDALSPMMVTLQHRGPDDAGTVRRGPVAFGFRRLSIIDLSLSHQPMSNEDGSIWIVFNGEIYNFQELRREIEATGRHTFKTQGDTEVIVHLYEEYGEKCVEKLRGMFAFAIWDEKKQRLFAARDRFGKKPFNYFVTSKGDFVFASELKALFEHPEAPRRVDAQSVNLFLRLQYIPAPRTIYKGIHKLPAAHTLTWSPNSGVQVQRYWDLRYEPKAELAYEEAKTRLRDRLTESVRLRMISDVPLGAFLSGGIDSSVVVALMAQQSKQRIKTFSIGFDEEAYSEVGYAREVAKRYDTDHQEFVVRPDLIDILPKLAWYYSEPFADASALPTYYLSKLTRQHVTVALTGDGGDEVFAGYLRYRAMWLMQFWNCLPANVRKAFSSGAEWLPKSEAPIGWSWRIQRLLKVGSLPETGQYVRTLDHFHAEDTDALWSDTFRAELSQETMPDNLVFQETLDRYTPANLVDRLMYLDLNHYLPDCLMTKTDIASMANSLEARSPFLDHVLAEEVARWPTSWKYRAPNDSKHILKETFAADLPPAIRKRGKQGFGVPISQWFRGPLKGYLREILLSKEALSRGYFKADVVERFIDEHQSGTRDRCYGLWTLLMLELWHRAFTDKHAH